MPKVSVLTPIYNTNPKYLRAAIESILNQTFTDFEFLILNDSPDNHEIERIVKEYARSDKRIKYYKNKHNLGISASRNKLLDIATGEYVAIFDHDDISLPNRLEKQVEYLDKKPDVGVVSGWLKCFKNNKTFICKQSETDIEIKMNLMTNISVFHTAAMVRKNVLDENNIRYESFYSPCEDYQLWARLMAVTSFHNLQTVLVNYRMSDTNTSVLHGDKMKTMSDIIEQDIRRNNPWIYHQYKDMFCNGLYLRLFGFIPFVKIKRNKVYLFEFIPLFKIQRR